MRPILLTAALLACLGGIPANSGAEQAPETTMHLTIDDHRFTIATADTPAAAALRQQLPLTLTLRDYNHNEKVGPLPQALPTADTAVGRIEAGDILLWQGDSLVIFYESFKTPYRYTRLGKITNPDGLKTALGGGSVTVSIEP